MTAPSNQPTGRGLFADWDAKSAGRSAPQLVDATTPATPSRDLTAYGAAALAGEIEAVRTAPQGARNDQLNRSSLKLGHKIAAGALDYNTVRATLGAADTRPGDDGRVAWQTIDSGLNAGMKQAAIIADRNVDTDPTPRPDVPGTDTPPWLTQDAPSGVVASVTTPDTSTWSRVDLGPFLDGTRDTATADLFTRTDGVCLLYPGLVHSFHGESESGKSLLLQFLAVDLINDGEPVLFVDFESDPASITDRLLILGAAPDAIRDHFHYMQPEVRPDASQIDRAAWLAMLGTRYRLAIIDGVTDALTVHGYATKENDDVTAWMRSVPKMIAARTGAAVCIVDHVTKDSEGRGRFAIGGQAKMSGLTGAAYTVSIAEPLGRGMRGVIALRIGKDRPGAVRLQCGPFRKSDRTQEAARVVIDDTGDGPTMWTVQTWQEPGNDAKGSAFRPTFYMERVSRYVEDNPESTGRDIEANVAGKAGNVRQAVQALVAEGFIDVTVGARNAKLHTLAKTYRQATDPGSDVYQPGERHLSVVADPA